MEQYNIEDQLHHKLKSREITPSSNAWERVAHNRQPDKRKKKTPMWYWIAAAVIITSGLTLTLRQEVQSGINIVVQEKVITPEKEYKDTQVISIKQDTQIAVVPVKAVEPAVPLQSVITSPDTPIAELNKAENDKVIEVADAMADIAETGKPLTNTAIDSLLAKAQRELALEKQANEKQKADPVALLNEAEKEADKSFKDKAIKAFHHKFRTIKIALHD